MAVILLLVLIFVVPFLLAMVWKFRKRQIEHREAMALKHGNKIYTDWRKNAGSQGK